MTRRLLIVFALCAWTGCASLDRFGTKLEMMAGRISEGSKAEYEGRLTAIRPYGSMMALEFADGQVFDVEEAHLQLTPGDVVRIYKTHKGYEARLWRVGKDAPAPAAVSPVASNPL